MSCKLIAAFSLYTGGGFGRWFGILAAGLSAISALLSLPAYPFWSLCIFALAIIILYELAKAPETTVRWPEHPGLLAIHLEGSASAEPLSPGRVCAGAPGSAAAASPSATAPRR